MSFLLPPFGYASTFYRFKYFFSFLKRRHPQIVADIPHRIDINNGLPVLIIVKNADIYPVKIDNVAVYINQNLLKEFKTATDQNCNYNDFILRLDTASFPEGWHKVDIRITYTMHGKTFTCFNDNYRTTSHAPLDCFFAQESLPNLAGFISGDMHSHSNFTDDQIEFGASLSATREMAKALGLQFYAVTDHSYDLDDYYDDFLKNDPNIQKWHDLQTQVAKLNQNDSGFTIIPGEEVSVNNARNQTVHLLVYNNKNYFHGSGDSGEKWFRFKNPHHIPDVTRAVGKNALTFASHPVDHIPSAHKLLLHRGQWSIKDASDTNLNGVQIFNGHGAKSVKPAIDFWTRLLLKGLPSFLLAGNDGHGNFGRNRSIWIPFIKIRESASQLFGKWRTDVFLGNAPRNVMSILTAIKDGHFSVSNGPAIDLQISSNKKKAYMGMQLSEANEGTVDVQSNSEFGPIQNVKIYCGNLATQNEKLYLTKQFEQPTFSARVCFKTTAEPATIYFRAEVQSRGTKGRHFAFTNPIWIGTDQISRSSV